jgi:nicotinamide-nucleotide amidase
MLLISEQTIDIIRRLYEDFLLKRRLYLTTAESCTGGLIAAACTDMAGSSQWFERGFVTYSNAAKTDMLGVDAALIARFGAVSEEVAIAMAQGAIKHSAAQVSVAVTGVAGPTGGSVEKPVGTVWIAWYVNNQVTAQHCQFGGDRASVRTQTMHRALEGLLNLFEKGEVE